MFGPQGPAEIRFSAAGDPILPDRDNAVLLTTRVPGNDFRATISDAVAIRDRRGRLFIPIIIPPSPQMPAISWLPADFAPFVRAVRYDPSEMRIRGPDPGLLIDLARSGRFRGWVEMRAGQPAVLRGVYLDDLPALLRRQGPAHCWRLDPSLANPPPSR
ncbi:MAG TPA: hypothetical protein VK614_13005 [Allosphingosinicella sp.]|nr:hypothetical protein [Allosphingosinicella sp.]